MSSPYLNSTVKVQAVQVFDLHHFYESRYDQRIENLQNNRDRPTGGICFTMAPFKGHVSFEAKRLVTCRFILVTVTSRLHVLFYTQNWWSYKELFRFSYEDTRLKIIVFVFVNFLEDTSPFVRPLFSTST